MKMDVRADGGLSMSTGHVACKSQDCKVGRAWPERRNDRAERAEGPYGVHGAVQQGIFGAAFSGKRMPEVWLQGAEVGIKE